MKLIQGFKSLNASQRMFFISIFITCSYTIYLLFNFVPISIWSFWLSVVVLILCYIYLSYYAAYPNKWKKDSTKLDKDLVCIENDNYSVEIKTSSSKNSIFGKYSGNKSKDPSPKWLHPDKFK